MSATMVAAAGPLVREWRLRRGRSQMELALDVGVSSRHLSFVETGRSKASPELLLALSEHLEIPLRERNTLLLAAGYAPRYARTALDDAAMGRVRRTLQDLLDRHAPYPGLVIDHMWNLVLANEPALRLVDDVPAELLGANGVPPNVFRVSLHPEGLAARTENFPDWAAYLLGQVHRLAMLSHDPEVIRLEQEVAAYPNVVALGDWRHRTPVEEPALLIPWKVRVGSGQATSTHSYFTTLTSFGTPQDITLAELAVELFYPADDSTAALLNG